VADQTGIEWTDATWQATHGCAVLSPGCTNCYAMKIAGRLEAMGQPAYIGLTQKTKVGAVWNGTVRAASNAALTQPLRWKKPRRIFVDSMADLFADGVEDAWIDRAFAVMTLCPQHTFQVLTKRPERMLDYLTARNGMGNAALCRAINDIPAHLGNRHGALEMPLPNVWLGTSVEDQQRANERIPSLLETPAAVKFLSCEPLLGPIDFSIVPGFNRVNLNLWNWWMIVGGESGARARPNWIPNVRFIVRQCKTAGVPVFVKQLGANVQDRNDAGFDGCEPSAWPDMDPMDIDLTPGPYLEEYQGAPCRVHLKSKKGGNMNEWPEDLRIREMPR
jgi:protein gp37